MEQKGLNECGLSRDKEQNACARSLSTLDATVVKIFMRTPPITLIELSDQGRSEFFVAGERAKSISTRRAQNEIFLSPISKTWKLGGKSLI